MEISDYLFNTIPINLAELIAAIMGIFYLRKLPRLKAERFFVFFLWGTVIIEILGSYAPIAYFSDYNFFGFIKDTEFEANYWLFNIYSVLSFVFYITFFYFYLKNRKFKITVVLLGVVFLIVSIYDLSFGDDFFIGYSRVVNTSGSALLLITVFLFYFEILRSDLLFNLSRYLPMYISAVIIVYTLCTTPLDFLSNYFKISTGNEMFVKLRSNIMLVANVLLYATYTIAFVLCSRKKKYSY